MKTYKYVVRGRNHEGVIWSVKYDEVGNVGLSNTGDLMVLDAEGDCIALHKSWTWTTVTLRDKEGNDNEATDEPTGDTDS